MTCEQLRQLNLRARLLPAALPELDDDASIYCFVVTSLGLLVEVDVVLDPLALPLPIHKCNWKAYFDLLVGEGVFSDVEVSSDPTDGSCELRCYFDEPLADRAIYGPKVDLTVRAMTLWCMEASRLPGWWEHVPRQSP